MNRHSPNSSAGRRQFLRDGVRYIILGGLAAVSGKLVARQAARPAGQVCISAGICRGCEAFDRLRTSPGFVRQGGAWPFFVEATMKPEFELFDRREFFGVVTKTAAIIGLAGGAEAECGRAGDGQPFCLRHFPFPEDRSQTHHLRGSDALADSAQGRPAAGHRAG